VLEARAGCRIYCLVHPVGPPCLSQFVNPVSRTDMRLELQFTKSGRKFRLWHLLSAVAVLGVLFGLLPERIGVPIVFGVICLGIVAIIACVVLFVVQKFRGK
jgi:lipopolysaccharide export LptBFGC system permease protein LptF